MGLADQIASANERNFYTDGGIRETDDLGLPIFEGRPDYIAARILRKNYTEYSVGKADLLHTRNNRKELWLGHEKLKQDRNTLYRLACTDQTIHARMVPVIYEMVRKCVRYLDTSKIVIDDEHYWDKNTGELKEIDDYMPTITPKGKETR